MQQNIQNNTFYNTNSILADNDSKIKKETLEKGEGTETSNTSLANYKQVASGIDKLELTYLGDLHNKEKLEKWKEKAQELSKKDSKKIITLGAGENEVEFQVLPHGRGSNFAYVLKNDIIELQLGVRPEKDNYNNLRIIFMSKLLWGVSCDRAYSLVHMWLSELASYTSDSELISRFDICSDYSGMVEIFDELDKPNFKTRARKLQKNWDGQTCTGFSIGKGSSAISCRIYNKTVEINNESKKYWMDEIHRENGAKGDVFRVEFQVRRKYMRNLKIINEDGEIEKVSIDTFDDLFKYLSGAWKYFVTEWLTIINNDSSNRSRCSLNECWSFIIDKSIDVMEDMFSEVVELIRDNERETEINHLINMIRGCCSSIAAKLNMGENLGLRVLKKVKEFVFNRINRTTDETEFLEKVKERSVNNQLQKLAV